MPSTADPEFERASERFLASFIAQPHARFHPALRLSNLRDRAAGRGIIATELIPADAELFVIPRSFVIGVETSELREKLPEVFEHDEGEVEGEGEELPRPWLDLILVLIYEYFHREMSEWRDYWGVLPEAGGFDTLMFWDAAEVRELQASAAGGKIGKKAADSMLRNRIVPVVQRHADVFYPDGMERLDDGEVLRLAHRMGSLIMAYAFDLEKDKEEEGDGDDEGEDGWTEDREGKMAMGMVPMADMLNADAEFNAHLEHGENELTMRSLREIKAGEEVLNYYGPLPNSDLLRRYGYTSPKHARYDVVEISWELIQKCMKDVFGKSLQVKVDGEELEESFVLERESGEPDDSGVNTTEARFTTFPEELVDQVTVFASAALGIKGKPDEGQTRRLKQSFLQVMARVLAARLGEYATTMGEDERLLVQGLVTGRKKMAVDVRLGEKRLLKEAQDLAEELLLKYSDSRNGASSGRPSKKQKTKK